MSSSYNTPGSRYVPEFQASGLPFASKSTTRSFIAEFPYLTQWISVQNNTAGVVSMSFSTTGFSTKNFFLIPSNVTVGPLSLAINKLYLSSSTTATDFIVFAGLTMIPANSYELVSTGALPALTGSVPVEYLNFKSYVGI